MPRGQSLVTAFFGLSTKTKHLLSKMLWFGGAMRDRTADLLRARQALSQLSYSPVSEHRTVNAEK